MGQRVAVVVAVAIGLLAAESCQGGATEDVVGRRQALTADLGADASAVADGSASVPAGSADDVIAAARARFVTAAAVASTPDEPPPPRTPLIDLDADPDAPALPLDAGAPPHVRPRLGTVVPAHADLPVDLSEPDGGHHLRLTLVGASSASAEPSGPFTVYRDAIGDATRIVRPGKRRFEDFLVFETAPAEARVTYALELDARTAGLRLVGDLLELVDRNGATVFRMAPPLVADASDHFAPVSVRVEGCAVDTSEAAPWGRAPTPPGNGTCNVVLTWDDVDLTYPAMLDPLWASGHDMTTGRTDASAISLPEYGAAGRVWVGGGFSNVNNNGVTVSELYDVALDNWSTSATIVGRGQMAAVRLANGDIFLSGGAALSGGDGQTTTQRIICSTSGCSVATPPAALLGSRKQHTASLVPGTNKVLLVGGITAGAS